MNPHFVFNSINSMLSLIMARDNDKAIDYLTKFSKLIRLILENSVTGYVLLKKEIDLLCLYMELEMLRFEGRFSYDIIVGDEIDITVETIPSMIIQPYIENSIRHGFSKSTKPGKIHLKFSKEVANIRCEITDNGIGRKKSEELKKEKKIIHKSLGMKVTGERMNLLNSSVSIVDLFETDGSPAGTKVVLILKRQEME